MYSRILAAQCTLTNFKHQRIVGAITFGCRRVCCCNRYIQNRVIVRDRATGCSRTQRWCHCRIKRVADRGCQGFSQFNQCVIRHGHRNHWSRVLTCRHLHIKATTQQGRNCGCITDSHKHTAGIGIADAADTVKLVTPAGTVIVPWAASYVTPLLNTSVP